MLISLYIFLTFFILYIIIPFVFITYNNFDEGLNVYLKQISSVIFIISIIIIFGQNLLYINLFSNKNNCSIDVVSFIFNTCLPLFFLFVFIFSERALELKWYKIFSNTYGKLLYTSEMLNIFKSIHDQKSMLLIKFYANPILLAQELNYDNDGLKGIFGKYDIVINEDQEQNIKKILIKKDLVGYFILLFFICYITSLFSVNLVLSQGCGPVYD
jgi:hypothetical protein